MRLVLIVDTVKPGLMSVLSRRARGYKGRQVTMANYFFYFLTSDSASLSFYYLPIMSLPQNPDRKEHSPRNQKSFISEVIPFITYF